MYYFYKKCIFCLSDLPEKRTGEGEHVIPKNIYGSWKFFDICSECKKHFGNNIDQLAINDPAILRAMEELNLPEADQYLENLPYKSEDINSRRSVQMVRKDGTFKIKTSFKEDEFMECPEEDWEKTGLKWLRERVIDKLTEEDIEKELRKLKKKYKKVKPGETINSGFLGYLIRKGQVSNVSIDHSKLPNIRPLIAKIASCFMAYIDPEGLFTQYRYISEYARFNALLPEYSINPCYREENLKYANSHRILIDIPSLILDITFFGAINWRISLRRENPLNVLNPKDKKIERIGLIIDFSDLKNRKKFLGFKYEGNDIYDNYVF